MRRALERARTRASAILMLAALAGCKGHEFHPPDKAQQIAQADSAYSRALFDSIKWPSESGRLLAGNEVYARKCDKCHGPLGAGGTDYARANNIEVPSLVEPDWPFDNDHEAVRRKIFTGHVNGMPTWGVAELSPREIDAATAYVLEQLRPDALGKTQRR
ncbi:MAG TPA: cytochrome c [Longimicrobiales bacterium]